MTNMEKVIEKAERIMCSTVDRDMIDSFCEDVIALLKEDCHNCKLECLLQKYDELKEKYDAMPKEQEAKQVKLYGKEEWIGLSCLCPDCKARWMGSKSETHFCPNCRRPVKWG